MIQHLHFRPWTQLHSETECLWWDIDVDRKASTSDAEWARGWPEQGGERAGHKLAGRERQTLSPPFQLLGLF